MNGTIASDSVSDKRHADHPSYGELYDFFASRETELDLKRRQSITIHVTLCSQCASTGEFIEETEECLDAQLAIPPSESDHAGLERSLAMVRILAASRVWPRAPENPLQRTKQWISVSVRDFFYFHWGTVTGRVQLIAGSVLAAIALSVLGYGGYNLGVSTIGRVTRATEQFPDRTNPSSPDVAQASPEPTTIPPTASPSPQLSVKTTQPRRPPNETHGDQLLAQLNPVIDLDSSREAKYRGGGVKPKFHPTIRALSVRPTKIRIRLPDGSPSGSYRVTIEDPYFKPVAPPATGKSSDGKELSVSLKLGGLAPAPSYYLGIAPEGGAPMHYQVRLQVTKNSPSRPDPRSPR
jgi:hypothetical protein